MHYLAKYDARCIKTKDLFYVWYILYLFNYVFAKHHRISLKVWVRQFTRPSVRTKKVLHHWSLVSPRVPQLVENDEGDDQHLEQESEDPEGDVLDGHDLRRLVLEKRREHFVSGICTSAKTWWPALKHRLWTARDRCRTRNRRDDAVAVARFRWRQHCQKKKCQFISTAGSSSSLMLLSLTSLLLLLFRLLSLTL